MLVIMCLASLGLLYPLPRRCGVERGSIALMRFRVTIILQFIYQFNNV
jgi:hypothetical protein